MKNMKPQYQYKAYVTKVYDGDTITVNIDLGFSIQFVKQTFRLSRINTPEVRGEEREEGLKSRDYLRSRILEQEIVIVTEKDKKGKYGRYLAEIYIDNVNINDELVIKGLAEFKNY